MEPILPGITPLEECVVRIARGDEYEYEARQEINNIIGRIILNYGSNNKEIQGLAEELSKRVEILETIVISITRASSQYGEDLGNPDKEAQLLEEQDRIYILVDELRKNILKRP